MHNRTLDLEWILHPVLSKRAWSKVKYGFLKGITQEQYETLLAPAPNSTRYFASVDILTVAEDREWFSQATRALARY